MTRSKVQRKAWQLYLSQARRVWNHLPASVHSRPFGRKFACHMDRMVRLHADRKQAFATFFMRNRPELELLNRLVGCKSHGSRLDIAILACSKGAEVYSMAWAIRSKRPDIQLKITAVDISKEIVDFASRGVYSVARRGDTFADQDGMPERSAGVQRNTDRDQNAWIFERMFHQEIAAMFEVEGSQAQIRPYLKQGITWMCGDASSSQLKEVLGPQDIVVANRFLCHMQPEEAKACLRNSAQMVKPGGHLFVSGIDLDVRSSVALEMGLRPVTDLIREIHDGDQSLRRGWPVEYWGLEPLDDTQPDWQTRYASVFQVGDPEPAMDVELAEVEHRGK